MTQDTALTILKTGANVFLTGEPGSGKTHTINTFVAWLRSHGIEPAVTASTGIAATHIGGMTIHSWSGIGIAESLTPHLLDAVLSKEHVVKRMQKTAVLIIDEVSMLSGDVLTMVDRVLREARQSDRPFGGLQVVFVGDFFQLPPISKAGRESSFAFNSPAWERANPIVCYLSEQHRQEDDTFLELLTAVRAGTWDHTHVSLLTARETDPDSETIDDDTPRLFTHNVDVDRINDDKLGSLSAKVHSYIMRGIGAPVIIEALKRGCLSPEILTLKEGAVVMCTKNNPAAGYVNGTLGVVIGFEQGTDYPIIETRDGREMIIAPADWAVEEGGKIRASITQIPLRLAWAITIHKSQGMSMDAAAMDLSRAFEYGQGYVALSRVRTLAGLHLLGWSEQALAIHPKVVAQDGMFKEASALAASAFLDLEERGERAPLERNFIIAAGGSLEEVVSFAPVPKRTTVDETFTLIEDGKTLREIADVRRLTVGTIADHIQKLYGAGRISKETIQELLPEILQTGLKDIHAAFAKKGTEKLAPVFAALKGKYSYDDLALARILFVKK